MFSPYIHAPCLVGAGDTAEIRFLPCGQLDFESAVTAQDEKFKAVLIARIQNLAKKLNT